MENKRHNIRTFKFNDYESREKDLRLGKKLEIIGCFLCDRFFIEKKNEVLVIENVKF